MPKQPTKTSAKKHANQTIAKKTPKRSATHNPSTNKRQQANSVSKPQSRRLVTWIPPWATMAAFAVVFSLIGVAAPLFEHAVTAAGTTSPIVSAIGNKCLDTSWGQALSTARLEPCFNNSPQQWALPGDGTIRNNSLCLDVKYAGTTRGTTVWLYRCNGTVAQQWKVTATGQIINPHSNLCLDDRHSSSANGNPIWIWGCNGTNAQKWTVPKGTIVSPTPTPRAVSGPVTDPSGQPLPFLKARSATAITILIRRNRTVPASSPTAVITKTGGPIQPAGLILPGQGQTAIQVRHSAASIIRRTPYP